MKKRDLEDWELAECTALKNAVDAYNAGKPRAERLSQGKIADALGMNQGSVSSYLNGVNALNARVAGVIAGLIKVPVESFSPRLAKEISEMAAPIAVENQRGSGGLAVAEQTGTYGGAAAKVMEMLSKHGKNLTDSAQQRLLQAVSETLTEVKSGNVIPGNFSRSARVQDGDILIPQYDVRASMGHGQVPADYVEFVRNVVVNGLQLEKLGLEYTSPANLSIITGWGQSMAGTIDDKDPVIVDRGVTEFNGDGVYVLTWDGMLYIKRLQKADANHFDMISDNEKHKDRVVGVDDVTIHARVLYVWKGQKL
ncbi:helix-turn-helix transcriptional regulator [Ectopseudomonas khazarica]|uniref:LexA family transcriptional regulator n=1 Tax=Ectopseudomonas khazarica TaxID=2502979 RepID=UPI00384FB5D1